MNFHSPHSHPHQQRAFNAPTVVLALIGAFAVIHLLRSFLSPDADVEVLGLFAFFPVRYTGEITGFPGGMAADLWTFVTYAFLHGGIEHLVLNCIWLLVFGSPVAWRFGMKRFLAFCLVMACAGSLAHLVTHWGDRTPVIGASAVISGTTAAAMRFVFSGGGMAIGGGAGASHRPAEPLRVVMRNRTVLGFVVIWFVLNLAFGVMGGDVAWQAHIGGFIAGLLLFGYFDPPHRSRYLRVA